MRNFLLIIVILGALFTGCSKHATAPPASGVTRVPPALLATQPAPYSEAAPYDGEIWAQFDRPLDSRTVNEQNVYLKQDGQRVRDTVTFDAITRRVFIRPAVVLALQKTYTVEFSTQVLGSDGVPLPEGVFFQFTTNSLRRVIYDYPQPGALEGPVTALGWGGTKGPDGNLFYEVYVSDDSVSVAQRTVAYLQRSVFTRFLSSAGWPLGTRMFWAVTSENLSTHERMQGDVRSFRTVDASTPMDSVQVQPNDHGSSNVLGFVQQYCSTVQLPAGPGFNAALHWSLGGLEPGVKVAGVTVRLTSPDSAAGRFTQTQPTLWMAQNDWQPCVVRAPGPPFNELSGLLSASTPASPIEYDFSSPRLAAFVEAQIRGRTLLYGTLVRALANIMFDSPSTADGTRRPSMVVRFYRVPPAAAR